MRTSFIWNSHFLFVYLYRKTFRTKIYELQSR